MGCKRNKQGSSFGSADPIKLKYVQYVLASTCTHTHTHAHARALSIMVIKHRYIVLQCPDILKHQA